MSRRHASIGGTPACERGQVGGTTRAWTAGLLAVVVALSVLAVATKPAHAVATFTVNQTTDQPDVNLADSVCETDPDLRGLQCTLRAAIQEANDTPNVGGPDLVTFSISGATGVKIISPTSALPNITQPVVIDGYTQPGASVNAASKGTNAVLLIELSGANAGSANGLTLQTSNSVIKGLVINRFTRGIAIGGSGSTVVSGNRVEGNFIGTDPSGTQDLGNTSDGVLVFRTTDSVIGGASRGARNLVSGNGGTGIDLGSAAAGNRIEGNLVGTKATASGNLGNTSSGVRIGSTSNTSNNTVGGTSAASTNTIAFNGRDGVTVSGNDSSVGNGILRNSIFTNDGLGIDLAAFGVTGPTPNDAGDPDSGPNGLQNKPVLTEAVTTADSTFIEGALGSKPNTQFTIRFFSNVGDNEGRRFIGQKSVTTDASGNKRFTFSPARAVPTGQFVTATATGEEGTSEFSPTRFVAAP